MAGKYRLTTLGCKVNQYESEQLRELLETQGLRRARDGEAADIAIVNTCAVTCSAAAKSRQAVRKLANGGQTPTVVVGCGASADPATLAAIDGVVAVAGHDEDVAARLESLLAPYISPRPDAGDGGGASFVRVGLRLSQAVMGAPPEPGPLPRPDLITTPYSMSGSGAEVNSEGCFSPSIRSFFNRTRAFLKVQDGCDAHCSYCIIPKLRTTLSSKSIDAAVAEARALVEAGHREIVLTGIYLGAYGRETALRRRFAARSNPLATLVDAVARVDGLKRLRLSSLEPGDVDVLLLDVLARRDNCVPHLHLPLQSGSDDVLRRMNRQYTSDQFLAMIERVNETFRDPAITTDIMVGFPGETDAMFERTLAVARQSGFCKIHAFPFSPRPETAAARWSRQFVKSRVAKERMAELSRLDRELSLAYRSRFVGKTERVLIEGARGIAPADGSRQMLHGRCDRYFEVRFAARNLKAGDIARVRIDSVTGDGTCGAIVIAGDVAA